MEAGASPLSHLEAQNLAIDPTPIVISVQVQIQPAHSS
jgi:hypothetical protein